MKPGESRIARELPCPPHMYSYPNGYWMLWRAAERLAESIKINQFWEINRWDELRDAISVLRETAEQFEKRPCRAWTENKLGVVYEICCPACSAVFEWTGKFYAPRCTNCQQWLTQRNGLKELSGGLESSERKAGR